MGVQGHAVSRKYQEHTGSHQGCIMLLYRLSVIRVFSGGEVGGGWGGVGVGFIGLIGAYNDVWKGDRQREGALSFYKGIHIGLHRGRFGSL